MKKKQGASCAGLPFDISCEHFAKVQELAKLGSWKLYLEDAVVEASDEARKIYGLDDRPLTLGFLKSMVLSEYREMLDSSMENMLKRRGFYDVEYALRRIDNGTIAYVHSIAEYNESEQTVTGTLQDITERRTTETTLIESEQRYRTLFDNSVSGIVYADVKGNILEVNRKMLQLLGSPSREETKKINLLEYPVLVEVGFSGDIRKVIETGAEVHNNVQYRSKWGVRLFLEYSLTPIKRENIVVGVMGKIEDITDRKLSEDRIDALLREKDIILREVHHRIKNNMASIEALLKLQLTTSPNPEVRSELKEAVGRLGSMRVLYEKLYQSEDFMQTSSKAYLARLIDEIAGVFPESENIRIEKDLEEFLIPSDVTFSLGIIINELMTNSLKYAFTGTQKDKIISVSAKKTGDLINIIVKDNGRGFDMTGPGCSGGFGLKLIRMLSKQINGDALFHNDNGTVFSISFNTNEEISAPS